MKKWLAGIISGIMVMAAALSFTACGPKKNLIGFDIEFARAAAAEMGVDVKFQVIDWENKFIELKSKNIDLIWNGMTIKPLEMNGNIGLSNAYLSNSQVCVIRVEDREKYNNLNDIKGKEVAVENGSAGQTVAQENGWNVNSLVAQSDALFEVFAGSSDVAVIDVAMAYANCSQGTYKDKLMMIEGAEFVLSEELYAVGARLEDTGVLDKVNSAISALYANGKIREWADKYELTGQLLSADKYSYTSNGSNAGWDYIKNKGTLVVGYTIYAPIAYMG